MKLGSATFNFRGAEPEVKKEPIVALASEVRGTPWRIESAQIALDARDERGPVARAILAVHGRRASIDLDMRAGARGLRAELVAAGYTVRGAKGRVSARRSLRGEREIAAEVRRCESLVRGDAAVLPRRTIRREPAFEVAEVPPTALARLLGRSGWTPIAGTVVRRALLTTPGLRALAWHLVERRDDAWLHDLGVSVYGTGGGEAREFSLALAAELVPNGYEARALVDGELELARSVIRSDLAARERAWLDRRLFDVHAEHAPARSGPRLRIR